MILRLMMLCSTHEAAVLYSFGPVCLSVCLYVCLSVCQTITFESLDVRGSYLHTRYISRQYGSNSYMKVIRSRSRSHEPKKVRIRHLILSPIWAGAKRLEHRRLITTVHASLSGCWGLRLEGNLVSSLFFILGAKDPDDF